MNSVSIDDYYDRNEFFNYIADYDTIKYTGNDSAVFKQIVIAARTAGKKLMYSGSLDTSYARTKLGDMFTSVIEDVSPIIVSEPMVIEEPEPIVEEEELTNQSETPFETTL